MTIPARVRLRDVAAAAGVSLTTASHVLNETSDSRVSSATRAHVFAAAAELGYAPNALARSLRTGTHGTIGLVGEGIATTPLVGQIVLGAHEAVKRRGDVLLMMSVSMTVSGGHAREERSTILSLLHGHVDGVLFVAPSHRYVDLPDELAQHPVVVVNARSEDEAVSWVAPADEVGGWDAAEALIHAGHTRIAFVSTADTDEASVQRERGFLDRAAVAGLPAAGVSVLHAPASTAGAHEAAVRLLERPDRPTAIVCFNNRMAMGVYRAASQLGLPVPRELSIIGFDDDQFIAQGLHPPLTTFALPGFEMATWAVERLYAAIENTAAPAATASLRCPLVHRESVAPPPPA